MTAGVWPMGLGLSQLGEETPGGQSALCRRAIKGKGRSERHQDDKELNNFDDFIYKRIVQT